MANEKTSDYAALPSGTILDTYLFDIANPGALNYKGTALELKNYIGTGQEGFDATVGAVGSGADYNLVQDAIDASKFNLLVIGDYTNSETVVTGANRVTIVIAKKWTMNEGYVTIGAGGLDIWGNGSELHGIYTLVANKMFLGSGALRLDGLRVDTSASTTANTGISDLTTGTKHIINNCTFVLSNNGFCGFLNPRDNSLFTNLTVIGGGSSCAGFISEADKIIIDNINISGTVSTGSGFITSANGADDEFVLSNLLSSTTGDLLIRLQNDGGEFSNIHGKIKMQLNDFSYGNFSNIDIENFAFNTGNCDNNRFVNFRVNGSDLILIINHDSNTFVNCWFNPGITLAASNNNQFLSCIVVGAYTDSGTDNAFITDVSEDETLSADSDRLLSTQKAIKTYADNIAKGITVDYYFSDTPDGVIANYDIMFPSDTGESESTAAASLPAADTLIQTFITQTTEPNFTTLLAGIYDIHIHAAKTAGTKDAFIYAEFYKRTHPAGVETLLATSDNSALLTGSNVGYTLHFSLLSDEILDATDRLVVKFYGSPSGVGTDPTATLYLEGTNSSRIDIHTTTSSWMLNLQNIIYVNGAGNDSNDGKNMGTPKLTIAAALTAAALQSPSAIKIVVVKVLGGQRYAEDVTIPSWVVLDMSDALSYGQVTVGVTMGADSFYYFNEALMPSGKESIRCVGTGIRYIKGNYTTPETSSTFLSASGGATVYLDIVNADAVKTGAKFYDISTGVHLYLNASRFEETVASTSDAASNVVARIGERAAAGYTDMINHAGDFVFQGLASTGYVGFGGSASATYPRTKRKRYSGTLAAAGGFVSIPAATLGLTSTLQIVNATVWGWYPTTNSWIPNGDVWGEGINLRINTTGLQIETPAASTTMAAQTFHLVYEYQQTDFLTP